MLRNIALVMQAFTPDNVVLTYDFWSFIIIQFIMSVRDLF